MLTHTAPKQYDLARQILDAETSTLRKSPEYQVAGVRISLEDEMKTIRSQTMIPFPESASLGFTESKGLVKSKLKTQELIATVNRASHFLSDAVGELLHTSVGLFVNWASESGRGDAAKNRGRLHFILYLFERCHAIHALTGSRKLDELRILEKEVIWARTYEPFHTGTTNDTHFTDQVTAAHLNIRSAIANQQKEVSSTAAVTMLTDVETQTNITFGELKKYLFAFPSHVAPPVIATHEAYSTNNDKFVGSAVYVGAGHVFGITDPKEEIFTRLQLQLKSHNEYLRVLGSKKVVRVMSDPDEIEEEPVEEKERDDIVNFLKNQEECAVYNSITDRVCVYVEKSGEIHRFDLTALKKSEWDKKKLLDHEIDCLIEHAKIDEINRLIKAGIVKAQPVLSIPSGITAFNEPKARLKYWIQHKRMLKSACAIHDAKSVYIACKVLAKAYGDAGFFLIAQRLLELIIGIDQDIWRNLDNNVAVSYEQLLSFEAGKVKSVTHVSNRQITQAKDTIHAQVEAAVNSRNELVKARDAALRNLKNVKMSAQELLKQIFGVAYRYLDVLTSLNQLTTNEISSRRELIRTIEPEAVNTANAIDRGFKVAMQEEDVSSGSEHKLPAKQRRTSKAGHNGSADSLSSSQSLSDNEVPISPASSPVLPVPERRTPSPDSSHSVPSRDSTSTILQLVGDDKPEEDITHRTEPLPFSAFDLSDRKLKDFSSYRRAVFNRFRQILNYKIYADNIDPVTTLVSDYNLRIENGPAGQKAPEELFYSSLEARNKLAVALESNMIFNRYRWLPWNWYGWGRDLKAGRLVLCDEMCTLFTWALLECNDLPAEKIEAMYKKLNQHLENQKQYFGYFRGAAFNNALTNFQGQMLTDKNTALEQYEQLQSISRWINQQSGETTLSPEQKLLNANEQAKLLMSLPDSVLAFRVKKDLKGYVLSVLDAQLEKIEDKIFSNPRNPFGKKSAELSKVVGKLASLKHDLNNSLQAELSDLEKLFNFSAILQQKVSELEAKLSAKTNSSRLAEKNQATVDELLTKVKQKTANNTSVPPVTQEEKAFFTKMQKIMQAFLDNSDGQGSFDKMKQALSGLLKQEVRFSDENVSELREVCKKLDINWEPVKQTDLKVVQNLGETPKFSQGNLTLMPSPTKTAMQKSSAGSVKQTKEVARVRAHF